MLRCSELYVIYNLYYVIYIMTKKKKSNWAKESLKIFLCGVESQEYVQGVPSFYFHL